MTRKRSNAAIEYPELDPVNERYSAPPGFEHEDLTTGYEILDQPRGATDPRSTAAKIGRDIAKGRRDERLRQRREKVNAVGRIEDDALAHQRVQEARRAGQPVHPTDLAAAERHIDRHGLVPKRSTIDRLIEQGRRLRREAS